MLRLCPLSPIVFGPDSSTATWDSAGEDSDRATYSRESGSESPRPAARAPLYGQNSARPNVRWSDTCCRRWLRIWLTSATGSATGGGGKTGRQVLSSDVTIRRDED